MWPPSNSSPPFFWVSVLLGLMIMLKHSGALQDGDDCAPPGRPELRCTVLKTNCSVRDPSLYVAKPGEYPNSARDMKIYLYQKPRNGKYFSYINVSFKGPDSVDLGYVKAFEVKFTTMSGANAGHVFCWILNLTAANLTDVNSMVQTEFSLRDMSVRKQSQYHVNVRSLPEPSTTNSPYKDIYKWFNTPDVQERIVDINNTANWGFSIGTIFDENTLTVSFSKPPEEYKFIHNLVQLISYDGDKPVEADAIVTYDDSVVFKKINLLKPGLYEVWVTPNGRMNTQCSCKLDGRCTTCSVSKTTKFNITFGIGTDPPRPSTVTPTSLASTPSQPQTEQPTMSTPNPIPANNDLPLGVGISVAVIVLVVIMVVIFCLKRSKSESQKPLQPDVSDDFHSHTTPIYDETGLQTKILPGEGWYPPTKTILLLYYADDEDHQRAVFYFADFLERHCSINVYLHDHCRNEIMDKGEDNWVVEKMNMVDWIVILNSEGAYEQYRHITEPSQQDSHILSDMFLCALKMLDRHTEIYKHKFISAYFPYMDKKELILQFTPKGIHYRLMDDMEQFFLRVNNYEKYHGNEVIDAAIANSREYYVTEPGKNLKEIIDRKLRNASGASQPMGTSVEADFEHRNNFDSGIESGFKNPHSCISDAPDVRNLRPQFDSNWGDEEVDYSSSLRDVDADAWSCGSIGSAGRAEIDQFHHDCPDRPNYQQEANDIDVTGIAIDPTIYMDEYSV